MTERRGLLMDFLSNLVAFIVLFNTFAIAYAMVTGRAAWIYLLLAIPFALLAVLRAKVKSMGRFIGIHILFLAPPFLAISNIWLFVIIMITTLFAVIYSMYRKANDEWYMQGSTAVWVIAVLAGFSLFYAYFFPEIAGISILLNMSSLISLAAVVLFIHMDNRQFSLGLVGSSTNKKAAEMSPVSNILIAVFLIIIVIFAALSVLFPSEAAVMVLGRLVFSVLLLPFRFIAFILRNIAGDVIQYDELPLDQWFIGYGSPLEENGEQWEEAGNFAAIFSIITGVLIVIAWVALAVMLLAALIYGLYKAFNKKDEDGKQSLMPDDTMSRLKFVLGDFKEFLPRFRLGAKHPVRRAYIKKVNSHIKQGLEVRPSYTPEVIADKIRPKENIDDLTQRYEEVRYGKI